MKYIKNLSYDWCMRCLFVTFYLPIYIMTTFEKVSINVMNKMFFFFFLSQIFHGWNCSIEHALDIWSLDSKLGEYIILGETKHGAENVCFDWNENRETKRWTEFLRLIEFIRYPKNIQKQSSNWFHILISKSKHIDEHVDHRCCIT